MKLLVKRIVAVLMRLWSMLYTYNINNLLTKCSNWCYSLWICNFFGEVGRNTFFARPILLQGGGQKRIKIGSSTSIKHHTVLGCWECKRKQEQQCAPEIVIGDNCDLGEYCHITAINRITIGDGLLTGRFVYIGDNSHGGLSLEEAGIPPHQRNLVSKGEIIIGNNVWIGDKVSIFGGVTIGDNVIIGAGSIVTHDIPSNSLAAGVPAKVIKTIDTNK